MTKTIGIDLGTAYTRICARSEGIILRAPSVIAFKSNTNAVMAVGSEAKHMIGRTPPDILVTKPIRTGIVSHVAHASLMVGALWELNGMTSTFRRPAVVAALPVGVKEADRRATEDALFEAGASAVQLVEQPMAAAIGAGLKVLSPRGCMVVDIGAGTTEVAVISQGGVVLSGALPLGGEAMTDAVVRCVKEVHGILVGETTAEGLKIKLGTLAPTDRGALAIGGKSARMGGIARANVASGELREALIPIARSIAETIRRTIETMPPELSADVSGYGILLTGGGALVPGMAEFIKSALGISTVVAKDPMDSVITGLHRITVGGREMQQFIVSGAK